jgi:hypothetical protein
MWRRTFVTDVGQLEHFTESSPPSVNDRIEALRAAD